MASLYEIASRLNLKTTIPRVIILGQKSAGKSTIIEMILGNDKFCYSDSMRATCCPVIYNVQRISSEVDKLEITLVINEVRTILNLKDLNLKIKDHMEKIRASKDKICSKPIHIIIKTSKKNMKSITIIDMPGFEKLATGEENKKSIEILNKMNNRFIENLQKHDIVILVQDATSSIANDHLFTDEFLSKIKDKKCFVVVSKANS